jgi:hypothetical protein
MKMISPITVVTAFLDVFPSVAAIGALSQKAQDVGMSAIQPGIVPSTGQINNGLRKLPS